jgi:hypothetical protein
MEAAETWNSVLGRPALRLLTAAAPLAPGLDGLSAIYPSEATGGRPPTR